MIRAASVDNLRKELECGVCYEDDVPLRLIPDCQHTFCHTCIDRIIAERLEGSNEAIFACPECRREYIVPEDGFPICRYKERLREQLEQQPQQTEIEIIDTGTDSDSGSYASYASMEDIEIDLRPTCSAVGVPEYIAPVARAPPLPPVIQVCPAAVNAQIACRVPEDQEENELDRKIQHGISVYENRRRMIKRKERNCCTGFWSVLLVVSVLFLICVVVLVRETKRSFPNDIGNNTFNTNESINTNITVLNNLFVPAGGT